MKTKAAVLTGLQRPLELLELDIPALQAGQVLIKVLAAGICRTQLNEQQGLKGDDPYLPHLLGHEASALVMEIGKGVTKVQPGDTVVVSWIRSSGMDVGGGSYTDEHGRRINSGPAAVFSQYAVVSENRVVSLSLPLPPHETALLGCAVPTGVGAVLNTLQAATGRSIAIFGVGGVGGSAILGAVAAGCTPIIAVDIRPASLAVAQQLGADHTLNAAESSVAEKIHSIIPGGVDYAVEASGVAAVATVAFESLTRTGTLVLVGHPAHGEVIRLDPFGFIQGKKVVGTWGGAIDPDRDIPRFAQMWTAGVLPLHKLIDRTYLLDDINQAFDDMHHGRVIRAVLTLAQ